MNQYIYGERIGREDFINVSLLDKTGNIIWNKKQNKDLIGLDFFIYQDLIYSYRGDSNGIFKIIFDLDGNLISKQSIINVPDYFIYKQENNIYAIRKTYRGNNLNLQIEVIEFSLEGEKKRSLTFETDRVKGNDININIKNNTFYFFGRDSCNSIFSSCANIFCDVYNSSGKKINTLNFGTFGNNNFYDRLILNNGNIVISMSNFNKTDFDFRLYSPKGNLIKSKSLNFNSVKMNLFKNNTIGIVGGNNKAFSNNEKQSQFLIIDQYLEKIYEKKIGSFDNGETFNLFQEFDNFYYLIGNTDGTNGDFDIPNNTGGTDTFYIKLKK